MVGYSSRMKLYSESNIDALSKSIRFHQERQLPVTRLRSGAI